MSLVDLGKRLLEASKRGDTDEVRSLMANGAPFTTDWLGNSPLHFSALSGHLLTTEALLRAGISRDARTKVDRTPLHVASQEGHLDIVELLLSNSADIEAKDMLKMTPLHWAVEKAHIPVIQLLSKNGADINCPNKFDKSPLDISIYNGRADIAQILQLTASGQNVQIIEAPEVMNAEEEVATETIIVSENIDSSPEMVPEISRSPVATTESSDQSSTSVLATLAALAEATGPLNTQATSTTAAETLQWLQGITISTGESPTVITSAIESGQTITLTEAGKLALNLTQHGEEATTQIDGADLVQETVVDSAIETVVGDSAQKVITIVSDENQLVTDEAGSPIMVAMATDEAGTVIEEPPTKRVRLDDDTIIETVVVENDHDWLQEKDEGQDDLRRQLEEVQKQAEEYRQQLKVKELEAEEYKQQLNDIEAKTQK